MGNLMLCEKTGSKVPSDAVVTWLDGQGEEYCLRPRPQENQPPVPAYDPANGPFIKRHFTSAIFQIGCDIFVKVKWAPKGWSKTEGLSMRLVKERAPDVLLPEAIHFWYDEKWDRYFLIQRRIHGPTLDDVWWKLSDRDKWQVAREIGKLIHRLSAITAPRFQKVSGEPVGESRLIGAYGERAPGPYGEWGPVIGGAPGPFTPSELREFLLEISNGVEPPEMDDEFHFTHGDLSPTNVILSGTEIPKSLDKSHVHVASVIDWERAAFYPKFWIALYLFHPTGAHWLSLGEEQYRENVNLVAEYAVMVNMVLTKLGWPSGGEMLPWLREFVEGRNAVNARRAEERKLAKAVEKLRVE